MKNIIIGLFSLGLLLTFAPGLSKAQSTPNPPGQISYQGFLTDANGFPLATNNPVNYNVQFRIYNTSSSGTTPLWGELQVVTVDRGYFTVMLGNGSGLSGVPFTNNLASVFSGSDASDRYLEMTVQGLGPVDSPIQPRLRLLTTPYSYLASKALSVDASTPISDGNLSPNVALRNASQAFTGVNTFNNAVTFNNAATFNNTATFSNTATFKNTATFSAVGISAANILEFGAGVVGKEQSAGKIGYQAFTTGALDIVGAGTSAANRKIQLWAEGGANFTGGADFGGNVGIGTVAPANKLDVQGSADFSGNVGIGTVTAANKLDVQGSADFSGKVGIGTTTPTKGSLEIDLADGVQPGYNPAGWLTTAGAHGSFVTSGGDISIWASGFAFANTFIAFSDARIKDIQGQSDSTVDLKTLLGIQVTDFTYKDTIAKGNRPQKKVIAQQVEQVYPQAVSTSTDVVPDIYRNATLKDGWVQLATDLKVGERVKLIGEKQKGIYAVLQVRDGAFRTDFKPVTEQVFVYGREVKDFRSVDYEAIAMLNVSATQELAKRVQKLEAREAHLAELEQKASKVVALEEKVADLNKMVAQLVEATRTAKPTAFLSLPESPSVAVASIQTGSATVR